MNTNEIEASLQMLKASPSLIFQGSNADMKTARYSIIEHAAQQGWCLLRDCCLNKAGISVKFRYNANRDSGFVEAVIGTTVVFAGFPTRWSPEMEPRILEDFLVRVTTVIDLETALAR